MKHCPHIDGRAPYRHPLYGTWRAMLKRCNHPRSASWEWYGAKGIRVCERWSQDDEELTGFRNFIADMGPRPDGYTLDRIDSSGMYKPNNCRWLTPRAQTRNSAGCKLTPEKVGVIYRRIQAGERYNAIAADYGMTGPAISCIAKGKTWSDVTGVGQSS